MTNKEQSAIRLAAARLVRERLSEDLQDYPRTMPRKVLKAIEKHNEQLRQIVCDLIDALDSVNKTDARLLRLFDILRPSDTLNWNEFRQQLHEAGFTDN